MKVQSTDIFINLIQENERIIHKVIALYVDDIEDKKDCYQEVMVQAWKSYSSFEGRSSFSTWLYKVCLNTVLTFRKKIFKPALLTEDLSQMPIPAGPEKSELLYLLIKQLNEVDKMVITLHLDGYKNAEIGEITGMSTNNINVKIHRIKSYIIESFKKHGHGHL